MIAKKVLLMTNKEWIIGPRDLSKIRYVQTNRILRMCSEGVVGCLQIL